MPRYDYKCRACKEQTEVFREFADDHKPSHCGQLMERIWTPNPVHFKAGGFYASKG